MTDPKRRPYVDLRVGGFRVTADHFPARLLTVVVTAAGSVLGMWGVWGR
ncbi:hypothetical protein [Streptomyces sp. 4F14]